MFSFSASEQLRESLVHVNRGEGGGRCLRLECGVHGLGAGAQVRTRLGELCIWGGAGGW